MKSLFALIQDMYAERLGKAYVLRATWFFWGIYKIMSPFMSARTTEKIVFVNKPADLLDYFDIDQIPAEYREEVATIAGIELLSEEVGEMLSEEVGELLSEEPDEVKEEKS